MRDILHKHRERGALIIIACHDSEELNYLSDETIVIEDGKKYVGNIITVVVTSVLQTAAGRMIFAKPKEN